MENLHSRFDRKHIINTILKECYWDYNINSDDIEKIITSGNFREKQKLFSKIMYNAADRVQSLMVFDRDDLPGLFRDFSPDFRRKEIEKHVLVLRNILLGEHNRIRGLEWVKR